MFFKDNGISERRKDEHLNMALLEASLDTIEVDGIEVVSFIFND